MPSSKFLFVGGCADGEYIEVQTDGVGKPRPTIYIPKKYPLYKDDPIDHSVYRAEELRAVDRSYFVYTCGIQPCDLIAELIAGYTSVLHRRPKITQ